MRRSVPALCGPPLSSELGCSGWLVSGLSPGRRSTPAGGGVGAGGGPTAPSCALWCGRRVWRVDWVMWPVTGGCQGAGCG